MCQLPFAKSLILKERVRVQTPRFRLAALESKPVAMFRYVPTLRLVYLASSDCASTDPAVEDEGSGSLCPRHLPGLFTNIERLRSDKFGCFEMLGRDVG